MSGYIAGRMRARAAEAGEAWRLTLAELLELPGRQSLPSVLLVSAALTVLPVAGAGAVLSVLLWWVAWAWWRGHEQLPLPRRALELSLSPSWSRRCLHGLAWVYEQAERRMKPRWALWAHHRTQPWWGVWVSLMAALIFLPLPLGNVLPAVSLMLLALGWMFRDGLVLVLAGTTGVAALGYVVLCWELLLRLLTAALAHLPV
jgi:hypothetical protein